MTDDELLALQAESDSLSEDVGNYECMTCGLQDIEESTARRVQVTKPMSEH